jgi:transposase
MRIWIAAGITDMRRGFDGLAALVQSQLQTDPFSGQIFVFRVRRGDRIKVLWWDGDGLCLFAKRLEHGKFVWPQVTHGSVALTPAQDGDRRTLTPIPVRTMEDRSLTRVIRLSHPICTSSPQFACGERAIVPRPYS